MNEQDLIKIIDKYSSLLWGHGTESSHLVEFNKKLDKNETKIPSMDYRVFLTCDKQFAPKKYTTLQLFLQRKRNLNIIKMYIGVSFTKKKYYIHEHCFIDNKKKDIWYSIDMTKPAIIKNLIRDKSKIIAECYEEKKH